MSKNAMAGAVTLCGVGLCMIGGALLMQSGGQAHAAGGVAPVAAVAAGAAMAQAGGEPTVVWYGVTDGLFVGGGSYIYTITRAWSDGWIEARRAQNWQGSACNGPFSCISPWFNVSDPSEGYRAAADINGDEKVDAPDLTAVLSNWGDAPRVPFPPSDCPLNLINP